MPFLLYLKNNIYQQLFYLFDGCLMMIQVYLTRCCLCMSFGMSYYITVRCFSRVCLLACVSVSLSVSQVLQQRD